MNRHNIMSDVDERGVEDKPMMNGIQHIAHYNKEKPYLIRTNEEN